MKLKNNIYKALSILMLLCVFTTQVSAFAMSAPPTQTVAGDDSDDKDIPFFSQISNETVVPSHNFSFQELNKFFIAQNIIFVFTESAEVPADYIVLPVNTFFIKTFGHHIAINAP